MEIKTNRLLLRDHVKTDWKDIHEYASIPEFSQYDIWGPNSEDDSKNFVQSCIESSLTKNRFKYDLAVFHRREKRVIGGIGIRRSSESSLISDLGYAINPNFQGKGLATEAVLAMFDFAFNQLNLALIYATCDCRNIASYRVMEKVGMIKVGQILKHREIKGHWRDSYRYEVLSPKYSK
ncbi:GNAT family N-acetyltransferase [Bacteriovoracaceae bacterium]|nr:GNAT family N-acetyltransferase [Bacteriovoracaceae bacterium]